ncbi:MAG: archaeosine synthase subunit alpha, partial [Methanoregulaceae archaeon]|nr:archaeosine synthase subunit alpha [Methanoregulaceae archaeon]
PRFEVKKRDGLARTGIFAMEKIKIMFPCAIDPEHLFPSLGYRKLSNIPLPAGPEFVQEYEETRHEQPVPVHPEGKITAVSGDCIIVAGWHTALRNPADYVRDLIVLKEKNPPDVAWFAPAAALPSNVHLLCYSGFDLFDFTGVDLASVQGVYCLPEGEYPADWMERGLCCCSGCDAGDLKEHNRIALVKELALISAFIGRSDLRSLVESRCRMNAAQVSVLRYLDKQYRFLEQRVPIARTAPLLATTGESITRVEVRRFAERLITRYIPPDAEVAVLLPCSARKPYSRSQSHRRFSAAIDGRAHELILTSPLGLVPRDLELLYPAAHYDVPVTGYWDREEKDLIAATVAAYLRKHNYRRVIVHLEGGAAEVAMQAAEMAGVVPEHTCQGRPVGNASLSVLAGTLGGEKRVRNDIIRGVASWQFGEKVETRGMTVRGRYPRLSVTRDRIPLFSIDPGNGLLRPTFQGWELLGRRYIVRIDDFMPEGDILAPGVTGVDPAIREGDEVLVRGRLATATGRAAMGASEMERSSRGVAVKVRKVKKHAAI